MENFVFYVTTEVQGERRRQSGWCSCYLLTKKKEKHRRDSEMVFQEPE